MEEELRREMLIVIVVPKGGLVEFTLKSIVDPAGLPAALSVTASSATAFDGWKGIPRLEETLPGGTVARPRTWLLEKGWRKAGLIDPRIRPATRRRAKAKRS